MYKPSSGNHFFLFAIFLSIFYNIEGQDTTIKKETSTILTYPYSGPDIAAEILSDFNPYVGKEMPRETFPELVIEYANQGDDDEAIRVLEQSSPHPAVFYWLAWLYRNVSLGKSSQYLKQAEDMPPYFVFQYRLESIPVLTWAMNKDDSWKTKYYLGLIYWHIQNMEKAWELFERCGDIPDYAPFYILRATLFQNSETEYCFPCNDFSTAVRLNPEEWRTWHFLCDFLQTKGAFQEQLNNSKKAFSLFTANPVIAIDYAKALINTGDFRECIKILGQVNVFPRETAQEGHDIFELANLSIAVDLMDREKYKEALEYIENSKNWPANLEAGKPYEPDIRFQDYISAYCFTKSGNKRQAQQCFERIIRYSQKHWGNSADPVNTYIANEVFNENGKQQEAILAMQSWKNEQDSLSNRKISTGSSAPKVQWIFAKFFGEKELSEKLEKEIIFIPSENRFRLFLKTMYIINLKKNE
jgi:tetratricopeptide (TPR) repeat protein